jgi:3-oxoacyl-(acyl-carrier-protein) synthase
LNVITGIGLVSALGLDSSTSLAAARAGLSRAAVLRTVNPASEDFLQGSPVVGHTLPSGIGEGFVGAAKALVMGRAAIEDLLSRHDLSDAGRVGVYIVLSNYFLNDGPDTATYRGGDLPSVKWKASTHNFLGRLLATGSLGSAVVQRLVYGGHAGVAEALVHAERDLARGVVDLCVIGAIDSCVEPMSLRAAAGAGMLKTDSIPTGYIPGEAAAFFVLVPTERATGSPAAVPLAALATAHDPHHLHLEQPPTGAGLARAVEDCLQQLPAANDAVRLLVSDCNGDERRALEWGYCLVRLRPRYDFGQAQTWLPAMSFGETGCAAGAIAVCMSVRALQRGYAAWPVLTITLSSDDGTKAALCVGAHQGH